MQVLESQADRIIERRDHQTTFELPGKGDMDLWKDIELIDLIRVFSGVVRILEVSEFGILREEEYHVEDKMDQVREMLKLQEKINFYDLFGKITSKSEIIVTFWAILELYKMVEIKIKQHTFFGDIYLFRVDKTGQMALSSGEETNDLAE
jgi:segregation and condensation protein A